jgi:peptidoglycan hydrolase CwlO-like protein
MQEKLKALFLERGLDQRSVEFLIKAIAKNNLPGFDYLEYKQSLAALRDMNMDEETAFKSAFATAGTLGLTKDKLLETARHYKQVLEREKKQFDAAASKQVEQRIQTRQKEVEKMKKQIEDYRAKIAQLQEKIAQSEKTIAAAEEDIRTAEDKIAATQRSFQETVTTILEEIKNDMDSIEKFIA